MTVHLSRVSETIPDPDPGVHLVSRCDRIRGHIGRRRRLSDRTCAQRALGSYALRGAFSGQYPSVLRVAAIIQAALVVLIVGVVFSRVGVTLPRWSLVSRRLVRLVVAFACIGPVLNFLTPSTSERVIYAPTKFLLLVSSLMVVTGRPLPD